MSLPRVQTIGEWGVYFGIEEVVRVIGLPRSEPVSGVEFVVQLNYRNYGGAVLDGYITKNMELAKVCTLDFFADCR